MSKNMFHPLITYKFENEILELIDQRDDFTRGDLQGIVMVIVNKILKAGQNLPVDKDKDDKQFCVYVPKSDLTPSRE